MPNDFVLFQVKAVTDIHNNERLITSQGGYILEIEKIGLKWLIARYMVKMTCPALPI